MPTLAVGILNYVSIPRGAVKSVANAINDILEIEFQFQEVQLKV